MAGSRTPRPETSALARVARSLTGSGTLRQSGPPSDESSLLSQAVEVLGRQAVGLAALISSARTSGDRVTSVHRTVGLTVRLGGTSALRARHVVCRVGNVEVQAPVDAERRATIVITCPRPGVFPVEMFWRGNAGPLRPIEGYPTGVIHVTAANPVAAVDVDTLLSPNVDPSPLHRLNAAGWELIYLDRSHVERAAAVRARIEALKLPRGALLAHPAGAHASPPDTQRFAGQIAVHTLLRARADGVGVVLLVTGAETDWPLPEPPELARTDLPDLGTMLRRRGWLAARTAAARSLHARHRATRDHLRLRLDCMTGSQLVGGNFCRIVWDNHQARRDVLAAIEAARSEILMQLYIFRDSRFANTLAVHLARRAQAGVRVHLLVDALYSSEDVLGLGNRIIAGLRAIPNIQVIASDPIRSADDIEPVRLKERDHRKLIVVDRERAFVSGRNVGDEYYTAFAEAPIGDWALDAEIPWVDAHVELTGPIVIRIAASFVDAWTRAGGSPISGVSHARPMRTRGIPARFIVHDGTRDTRTLAAYEALFSGAREKILVVNSFPVYERLAAELRYAHARGVEVTCLIGNGLARRGDGSFFRGSRFREWFEYLTKRHYAALAASGVRVVEMQAPSLPNIVASGGRIRPYVHAKVICVDGRVASIGSANLDVTASFWEREAIVIIEDKAQASALEREIQAMIDDGRPLDLSSPEWRREAAQREIVGRLWPDILYS